MNAADAVPASSPTTTDFTAGTEVSLDNAFSMLQAVLDHCAGDPPKRRAGA